jgi:hypothetical protein
VMPKTLFASPSAAAKSLLRLNTDCPSNSNVLHWSGLKFPDGRPARSGLSAEAPLAAAGSGHVGTQGARVPLESVAMEQNSSVYCLGNRNKQTLGMGGLNTHCDENKMFRPK